MVNDLHKLHQTAWEGLIGLHSSKAYCIPASQKSLLSVEIEQMIHSLFFATFISDTVPTNRSIP